MRLAGSEACENQAFQIGRNSVGLQFHLETTPESAALILETFRVELVQGESVQTEPAIREISESACVEINQIMDDLLSYATR